MNNDVSQLNLLFVFEDEKEKQDPLAFRDAIVTGLNGTQNDLEQVIILYHSYSLHPKTYLVYTLSIPPATWLYFSSNWIFV